MRFRRMSGRSRDFVGGARAVRPAPGADAAQSHIRADHRPCGVLERIVDTDLERELAESVAAGAAGVARVVNSIGLNDAR